jgi:enoyl-CoA hydratase/carnithine racemase
MSAALHTKLRESALVVLGSAELDTAGANLLGAIAARHACAIAVATGVLRGNSLAAALLCDWVAVGEESTLHLSGGAVWGSAVARMGAGAYRLYLLESEALPATRALELGVVDALIPATTEPEEWTARWLRGRSVLAMQSAAMLLRSRGGDRLERAEFARLFATGQPRLGLRAFLGKQTPRWSAES